MKLFFSPTSPYVRKVMAVAVEIGEHVQDLAVALDQLHHVDGDTRGVTPAATLHPAPAEDAVVTHAGDLVIGRDHRQIVQGEQQATIEHRAFLGRDGRRMVHLDRHAAELEGGECGLRGRTIRRG